MSLLKNRTLLGILCIILSLIICFAVVPLFNAGADEKTEIVRVTKEIMAGEIIDKNMIRTIEAGAFNLPANVIKDADMVIGKYAAADFSPGDYILTTKVSDDPTTGYVYLHGLNRTKQAISVTVNSLAAGLSGKLMAGDIVSIIVPDFRKMGVTVTPPELQFVEVIAATASTGYDTNRRAAGGNGAEAQDEKKELHVTITLLASPEQSRLLAELEADSKIHIALVYRGPHDDAAKFLQAQDDVIAGLYAPEEGGDEDA